MRLDVYLALNKLTESRTKAQHAIINGLVKVNNLVIAQPAFDVKDSDFVDLLAQPLQFVSKGGDKLQKALTEFNISLKDKTILDIGASTGGFTDCCVQNGAAFVYAVDVGTNQLHESLHNNIKVKSIEQLHIKDLSLAHIDNKPVDVIVIDVSFISVKNVLPEAIRFLKKNSIVLALIKPQFEISQRKKFKGGIVKDPKIHSEVLNKIKSFALNYNLVYQKHIPTDVEPDENKNLEFMMLLNYTLN